MEEANVIEKQYKQGLNYKQRMGFLAKWPIYERFRAGDQWPAATERTRSFPRPVFNIIDYIQGHKESVICNENIKMVYTPEEGVQEQPQDDISNQPPMPNQPSPDLPNMQQPQIDLAQEAADSYTKFAEHTWDKIGQSELNREAMNDASNLGTCVWHYYWDNEVKGGNKLAYIGDMQGEVIDPMNYFPGNPQLPPSKLQKQPYNIVTYRDMVSNIKKEAEENGVSKELLAQIVPDKDVQNEGYDTAKIELDNDEKATVLVKYWKDKGTIWFKKTCSNIVVKPDTDSGMELYPIVSMAYKRRKKCAFGIGDTEGIIPNQKGINLLSAMLLQNAELTGFPKLLVNRSLIQQKVTNKIGEILYVDGQINGAADYLKPGPIGPQAQNLIESYMTWTKNLNGATESGTGELQQAGQMNAAAISLLQQASGVPIDGIRKGFYRAMNDIGKVWEQFFKVKYNTERIVSTKDENGKPSQMKFNGARFKDINLDLKVDVGPASSYSESMAVSTLETMYKKGDIIAEEYLENLPKNYAPNKDKLIKSMQQRKASLTPPPQDKINVTIAFKDLPSVAKAELLNQIGIPVSPQDIQQETLMQNQAQNPIQPPIY